MNIYIIKYKTATQSPQGIGYSERTETLFDELDFIARIRELAEEKIETIFKNELRPMNIDIRPFFGELRELNASYLIQPIIQVGAQDSENKLNYRY
jgi:hypothetical protein